jgi:hypothetical protein
MYGEGGGKGGETDYTAAGRMATNWVSVVESSQKTDSQNKIYFGSSWLLPCPKREKEKKRKREKREKGKRNEKRKKEKNL